MSHRIQVKALPFAIAMLLAVSTAHGQNTSSAITGQVVDAQGKPVAGATVTIVNVPSGTTRVVTTDAKGVYNAQGLRVGGPFEIKVGKQGLESVEKDNVYLKLAETGTVNFTLGIQAKELNTVTVTGTALNNTFNPDSRGLTTNVTQQEIQTLPATGHRPQSAGLRAPGPDGQHHRSDARRDLGAGPEQPLQQHQHRRCAHQRSVRSGSRWTAFTGPADLHRHDPGNQRLHQQLRRHQPAQHRRADQRGDQERHQPVPRRSLLRIPARQVGGQGQQRHAVHRLQQEHYGRFHPGWPDHQGQVVLLRRL
ncbi:MAG: hypothetical protein GJU74_08070 [Metallibacterium scheffleri]|nr:hypothetical protein [Metallibacterium scheffleri]